jgi:hypothetical protein
MPARPPRESSLGVAGYRKDERLPSDRRAMFACAAPRRWISARFSGVTLRRVV